MLSQSDKDIIMDLAKKSKDVTLTTLTDLFAYRMAKDKNGKLTRVHPKININGKFILKKGEFYNDKEIETTVGNLVLNAIMFNENIIKVIGYQNQEFSKSSVGKLDQQLANLVMDDKITTRDVVDYLDNFQWISLKLHPVLAGSFTKETLMPDKKVLVHRDKLLKENKEAIDNHDSIAMVKIEKELLEMAKKDLEGNDGMNLYNSGARGSFGNNFKNISIIKGPILNPQSGHMEMVSQSYMEGIKKEDIYKMGNSVVTGAYPKAIGTADAGYFTKQIIAMMQSIMIDPDKNSDCGSKNYLRTTITKSQDRDYLYRYIQENGKLVMISPDNLSKYVGKPIKMRSPMYCLTTKGGKVCNKCAGELYYKIGIYAMGLTSARISGTVLNLGMKSFHDSSAKTDRIDHKSLTL